MIERIAQRVRHVAAQAWELGERLGVAGGQNSFRGDAASPASRRIVVIALSQISERFFELPISRQYLSGQWQ